MPSLRGAVVHFYQLSSTYHDRGPAESGSMFFRQARGVFFSLMDRRTRWGGHFLPISTPAVSQELRVLMGAFFWEGMGLLAIFFHQKTTSEEKNNKDLP